MIRFEITSWEYKVAKPAQIGYKYITVKTRFTLGPLRGDIEVTL